MIDNYDRIVHEFRWNIPTRYNLGQALSDLPSGRGRGTAILAIDKNWRERRFSFADLARSSNRLANKLAQMGLQRNDRIAVLLPSSPEAAIAHIAIWKSGLISVPLQMKDHPDAIVEKLRLSAARVIFATDEYAESSAHIWNNLPDLRAIMPIAKQSDAVDCALLKKVLSGASDAFQVAETRSDEPAVLAFTSGTEGVPKGVLHAHRVVVGGLPAMLFSGMPDSSDLVWSHFDWGWLGGLLVPLIAWHCGAAVLVYQEEILNPFATIDLLRDFEATRISVAPTALKMLQHSISQPNCPKLRSITAGGEKLDELAQDWVLNHFGFPLSELYGLSECGAVLGSGQILPVRSGSLGKPPPGQTVRIIAEDGSVLGPNEVGYIAVLSPHPQMFLGYWNDAEATESRFLGSYFNTGDTGFFDERGYFTYSERGAEIIKVGGNRVGPSEIEQVALRHPAVSAAAAIGLPDQFTGEAIVLCVELQEEWDATPATEQTVLTFLRQSLAAYKIPRRIRFLNEIPRNASGKIRRFELRSREMAEIALSK